MRLGWAPSLRLAADGYEAHVSPMAGARVSRLVWQSRGAARDLIVPTAPSAAAFDPDHWPKCGAFPMVPYTNRLLDGRVWWAGRSWQTRVAPGQKHGVHGFGHRVPWHVESHTSSHAALVLEHAQASPEWPWPFAARIEYGLSAQGLSVSISVRNTADEPAPASIGWHPYFASGWRSAADHPARSIHDLGGDGLAYPRDADPSAAPPVARDGVAHTFVFENAPSPWKLRSAHGEVLTLGHDGLHVVYHQPACRDYECVEPITALPGTMTRAAEAADGGISLSAGGIRHLHCRLSASIEEN
ncbi:MAG: hypothetical protein J0H69_04080 [Burkholderiales bacterium]|nr:hypothetical protein [Burkholderiales bacterium]